MPKSTKRIVWGGILIPFGLALVMNIRVLEPLYLIIPISLGGIACFVYGIYSLNKGLANSTNVRDTDIDMKPNIKIDTADIVKMTSEQLKTLEKIVSTFQKDNED